MIGLVIVSHSAKLAEGICELAAQVGRGAVHLAPAGGTGDAEGPLGTNAFRVVEAIQSLTDAEAVLVLTDLGSAVVSAETALELLPEAARARVRICPAPLVEAAVAAASLAAADAGVEEIVAELSRLRSPLPAPMPEVAAETRTVVVKNPLGLHARPAAALVRLARRFPARVTVENRTRRTGPAEAASLSALLSLEARQGDELRLCVSGDQARTAADELARWFEAGCGDAAAPAPAPRLHAAGDGRLRGLAASEGIAIGPLARIGALPVAAEPRPAGRPAQERARLEQALTAARDETQKLFEWARRQAGEGEAGIFDAQALLLEDPALIEEAFRLIAGERLTAEEAWTRAWRAFAARLEEVEDDYLRARAADVADVGRRVLAGLTGGAGLPALERPSIVLAAELAPSQVQELAARHVLGICLESGGAVSHSVILARALGIPVVAGLGPALAGVSEGTIVAVDGGQGAVWVAPDEATRQELERRRAAWLEARRAAEAGRFEPAQTRDGRRIRVLANLNSAEAAAEAVASGAEGVGVLRTEFLFLGRSRPPDEEEQAAVYAGIAEALGGRPLVVRTLDVGADKPLSYVQTAPEANPFLGCRGIRLSLIERDLFRTQLRAIVRVAARYPVELLLPMVTSPEEVREAKAELEPIACEAGVRLKVGVMIETPAAVVLARELAREVDFFSIGTNDLAQYVMAADRTNPRVAPLADALDPAVLRMVADAARAAREAGIPVALCGELAAEPLAAELLIGLGIDELSLHPALIPRIKRAIRAASASEAEQLARQVLALETAAGVRRLLASRASTSTTG